ncbi:MAG TPA: hypothetical protein DEB46_06110 [Myxococcales bacterium]|nr:hypothetical protein [Myxococcales bacterium]
MKETLYSQEMGKTTSPGLVLIHGFFSDSESWQPLAMSLAAHFRVLLVDLPGHGRSAAALLDLEDWHSVAKALHHRIAAMECRGKPIVAGYSMGARTAMQLAIHKPNALGGLILISGHPGYRDLEEAKRRRIEDEMLAQRLDYQELEEVVQEWERKEIFQGQSEKARERQRYLRLNQHGPSLALALRRFGSGTCMRPENDLEVNCPVHVITGDRNNVDQERAQSLSELFPSAELTVMANCGHNPLVEAPVQLGILIRQAATSQ